MEKYLINIEFFSNEKDGWSECEIIGTFGEKSFIVKSNKVPSAVVPIENIRQITKKSDAPFEDSITEYEISKGYFIGCKIKSHQGKFFSVTTENKKIKETYLAREKQIRYITFIDFSTLVFEHFSNLILSVPRELVDAGFTTSENYKDMLKDISDESFYHNLFPSNTPSNIRIICLKEKAEFIKAIIETAIENEVRLCSVNNDKSKTLEQIADVQQKNKTFSVKKKLIGLLIGTQGANIKALKKKYGVTITINTKTDGDAIVTVSGDNGKNVENCANEMNIKEVIYNVKQGQEHNLRRMAQRITTQYNLRSFYVSNKESEDVDGKFHNPPNLIILGSDDSIKALYREIKYYVFY